jgi:O-antigen ligase
MKPASSMSWLQSAPFLVLLAILPFPHTVALRMACVVAAFAVAVISWRRGAVPPLPCKPAIAVWVLLSLASLVWAFDRAYSLAEIKVEILYPMMVYFSFFVFVRDAPRLRAQMLALACGAAFISGWAIAGYVAVGFWDESSGHDGVGNYAAYAVTMLPALLLLAAERRSLRLVAAAVFVLVVVAGTLSAQRIFWPVVSAQLLVALGLAYRTRLLRLPLRTVVLAAVAVAVVGGSVLLVAQSMRYESKRAPVAAKMVDADTRWKSWPKVAERILEHPVTGAGFGRQVMMHAYPDLIPPENTLFWHAHNTVLNYGLSMGLPGIAAILFLFLSLLWQHWKLLRDDDALVKLIGIAGVILIVGVFLRNQVNDFFVRDGALLFWALNGAFLGVALRRSAPGRAP